MKLKTMGWKLFGSAALVIGLATPSEAQYFGRTDPAGTQYGPTGPTAMQMVTNPYLNPSLNPFLAQGAANNPLAPQNAALYYWMAQQQAGGLANGMAGAARQPQSTGLFGNRNTKPVARSSYATNVPGAGASGYFQGGWNRSNSASKYYNRTQGHYMNSRGNSGR